MALRGTFDDTDPEDLLQILALSGRTGILSVADGDQTTKLVFKDGRIIDAFDGLQRGEDAVCALLLARCGVFTFTAEEVPEERTIDRTVTGILLAASQRVDDLTRARDMLRGPTARPHRTGADDAGEAEGLTQRQRALLAKVDGARTVGEIVATSDLSLEEGYTVLADLAERGAIDVATAAQETSPLSEASGGAAGPREPDSPRGHSPSRPPTAGELREIADYLWNSVAP